jgi:SAM-dependent methyltransferase
MIASDRQVWDRHWRDLEQVDSLFGRLASLVRRTILRRAVRHYAARWLPAEGVLLEAGCGTGEASAALLAAGRCLVGLDHSLSVQLPRRGCPPYRCRVVADLHALPFREGSLAGAWNLGVLEHFPADEGVALLRELHRALRAGGVALLFWPPSFGLSRLVLAPVEWTLSVVSGRRFRFFPDEVNRLASPRHGRAMLESSGFQPLAAEFGPRDAFIHLVLVGSKPA